MAGSHRAGRLHFWLGPALIGLGLACLLSVLILEARARAQAAPDPAAPHVALPKVETLQGVQVPEPPGLSDYVQDKQAAIALGKVFFWDQQVGGDQDRLRHLPLLGRYGCASQEHAEPRHKRARHQVLHRRAELPTEAWDVPLPEDR